MQTWIIIHSKVMSATGGGLQIQWLFWRKSHPLLHKQKKTYILPSMSSRQLLTEMTNSCWNLCFICNTCLILFQWLSEIPKNLVLFCKFLLWIWCLFHLLLRSIITLETRICPPKWLPFRELGVKSTLYTSMGLFWEWMRASSVRWDLSVAPEFSQLGPLQGPYQARVKIW
jgi:hypothetical protein